MFNTLAAKQSAAAASSLKYTNRVFGNKKTQKYDLYIDCLSIIVMV